MRKPFLIESQAAIVSVVSSAYPQIVFHFDIIKKNERYGRILALPATKHGSNLAKKTSAKTIFATCAFAFVFSVFCATGYYCVSNHPLEGLRDYAVFICLLGVCFALFLALFLFLKSNSLHLAFAVQNLLSRFAAKTLPRKLRTFALNHEFATLFAVIAIAWLPCLISFFPGIVMYDTTWELFQTQGSGALTMGRDQLAETTAAFADHKPVFHAFLIGLLFDLGSALGSQTLGIFAITLFQYLAMAFAFAHLLRYCYLITGMRGVQIAGLLFFALFPVFPMYAVTPFNDCLAAAAFIVWAVYFSEAVRTRAGSLRSKKTFAAFLLWGIAAALLKKPNVYIVLACAVALALYARKSLPKIAVQGIVPAALCLVLIPAFAYPILNVVPGDKGEMLGELFQQTVTYAINHEDSLSDSDRDAIDKVIALDKAVSRYKPNTFDSAKYFYRNTETTAELMEYLAVWAKQGLSDPLCYLSTVARIQYPWVFPSETMDFYAIDYDAMKQSVATLNADYTHGKSLVVSDSLNYRAPTMLEGARTTLLESLYTLERTPVFNFLLSVALYATWIPLMLTFVATTSRKRTTSLVALAPMYASMAVLLISPIVMCRYALPVFSLIPLTYAVALSGIANDVSSTPKPTQCCEHERQPRSSAPKGAPSSFGEPAVL